jgi:hypothetical protein
LRINLCDRLRAGWNEGGLVKYLRGFFFALILAGTQGNLPATEFTFQDLNFDGGQALALNDRDQILALDSSGLFGFIQNPDGTTQGVDMTPPNGGLGIPFNLNNHDDVVGSVITGDHYGLLLSNGQVQFIGPIDSYRDSANAINNSGQIVGQASEVSWSDQPQSFIYDPKANGYQYIKIPGATQVYARDINDHGVIVGSYCTDLFVCSDSFNFIDDHGKITTFQVPGTVSSGLAAINNAGELAGSYQDREGRDFGYLDLNGDFTTISRGLGDTAVLDLNNQGQVLAQDDAGFFLATLQQTPEPTTLSLLAFAFLISGIWKTRPNRLPRKSSTGG